MFEELLIVLLVLCFGIYLGYRFERSNKNIDGTLWFDKEDLDSAPIIYLELGNEPFEISKKHYVKFQVKNKNARR